MTFETLQYIHRLLATEEMRTNEVYKNARNLQYEYEEHDADKKLIQEQKEAADAFMRIHSKALSALTEFESHEWR